MASVKRKNDDCDPKASTIAAGLATSINKKGRRVLAKGEYNAHDPLIVTEPKRKKKGKSNTVKQTKKVIKELETVPEEIEEDEKEPIKQSVIAAARRYQIEVLEKALQGNLIVYLETGCGKTLIAVLLIKNLAHVLRDPNKKVVAVFLAPTVCLVEQQTEVLKINTDLKVDSFYGAKGVDYWSGEIWQAELSKNEVLVMTPQVFLDALRHGFIKMQNVELLILDECHHAQKHHAYAKIMREYYHTESVKKPKIFGMTASPVNKKGVSSGKDCAEQMQRLEFLLDAKVYTLKDRVEVESYVPTPVQKTKFYDQPVYAYEVVKLKLDLIRDKYQELSNCIQMNVEGKYFKDDEDLAKKLRKRIRELHGSLYYCLHELGLWCACKAANFLLEKDKKNTIFEVDSDSIQNSKESFLCEASQILKNALSEGDLLPIESLEDAAGAVERGLITPKVLLLIECLLQYRNIEDARCIVFVERVIAAMAVAKLVSQIGCLSFLKFDFLAGITACLDIMGKKQQQNIIEHFRVGKVNVLVATDVAEEGLDVQSCSSVIRFDLPKSVRSFIQSRGRARQPGSDYIIFLERDNQKQEDQLLDLVRSEESMRAQAINRTELPAIVEKDQLDGIEFYRVESSGAMVNMDSSISFINRFCSKLPGDRYYQPRADFLYIENAEEEDGVHICCKLIMPPNGPFQELVGPPRKTRASAKKVVCLEACKKLHLMGQITDHLLPVNEVEKIEDEVIHHHGKNVSGAGTRKRKELHPTAAIANLNGDWINKEDGILLQAYILSLTINPECDDPYSDFVLLTEMAIDEDIANTSIPLFLTRNRVAKAKLSAAGNYFINGDQLMQAKAYHELVFNGMFGKLMTCSKNSAEEGSSMVMNLTSRELWTPSCMYLLLPLVLRKFNLELDAIPIDWNAIQETSVAARMFSSIGVAQECDKCLLQRQGDSKYVGGNDKNPDELILQMACGPVPIFRVRDMAVVTIHRGKVYSVMDILNDTNADCPIQGLEESKKSKYQSYKHYFKYRYGKVLKFPEQPLLQLKQSHRLYNLLTRHIPLSKGKNYTEKIKEAVFVEIPPELCWPLGISNPVVRTLYLIPSIMHRLNALLSAGQLRNIIAKEMPQCASIEASQMMEALTTLRCLESFSFEGLESLGDSFLKYAVSRYLFLVYDKKHEGQLSERRRQAICNATLHRLAVARGLPEYIRDEPFDPGLWFAPGMHCNKAVVCKCNLSNLVCVENEADEKVGTNKVFRIGKACNKGHRWICSKTVSDVVEALIGAYLVGGGPGAALGFMKWLGMEIEFDWCLIKVARERSAVHPSIIDGVNTAGIERQVGYVFQNKSLLVEAITHASQQDPFGGCCYQRLEFLGDAVLDFLITRHLFLAHPGLTPGVISDLRSAAVNNECFARTAVKHNLQRYLRHGSGALLMQITEFVKALHKASKECQDQMFGWEGVRGPKVLGDIVESVAGAILVDSGSDWDAVWTVMKPLLAPIVTPSTLPLQPVRELHELCQFKGFSFTWKKNRNTENNLVMAVANVQLENELITETAYKQHKKTAQKDAAQQVLLVLKSRGICHPRQQVVHHDEMQCFGAVPRIPLSHSDARQDASPGEKRSSYDDDLGSNGKRLRLECDESASEHMNLSSAESKEGFGAVTIAAHSSRCEEQANTLGCMSEQLMSNLEERNSFDMTEAASSIPAQEDVALKSKQNRLGVVPSSSVNLKGSPVLPPTPEVDNERSSKVEDERDMNSSEDSVIFLQPLNQNLDKRSSGDKRSSSCHSSANLRQNGNCAMMISREEFSEVSGAADISVVERSLDCMGTSLSIRTFEKGRGRASLRECCMKNRWAQPIFELTKEEGFLHARRFTYSCAVDVPSRGPFRVVGDPMPSKKKAMDDAAIKLLFVLEPDK